MLTLVFIQIHSETGYSEFHDVKNQAINEQERAILERCVNSIFHLHKK